MELSFASAMVQPPTVRCIGIELLPFSLGHLLILEHCGSGFVNEQDVTFCDLIEAAFVCAHTWEQNLSLARKPFRRWLRLKAWGIFAGKFNIAIAERAMRLHIETARSIPSQKRPQSGACRYLASEWTTRLYKFLRANGIAHSEALNMPLCIAQKMLVAELEETEKAEFHAVRDDPITRAMARALDEAEASGLFDKERN